MSVRFGSRDVGDGFPCFITFEAGATHNGLESAKRLVSLAAQAGADAVKFQIADPDRLIADKGIPFTYKVLVDRESGEMETVTEPLYDIICRRVLTWNEWREVKGYSDSLGLAFFTTVCFDDEVEFVAGLGCHSIKIASSDVNNFPLMRKASSTGLCIQLDTGSSTIGEVEAAVDVIRGEGNENIIIHQCPSGYPARLESINLNIIPTLKRMFPYPIAFSDHTPGWEMDIAAIAMGANLVEKTITDDRTTRSVEHVFSLEPHEMKRFVKNVRDLEVALGKPRRMMSEEERELKARVRRSAFLKERVRRGQPLKEANVEFRRPGFGISPAMFEQLGGMRFRSDLPEDHMVSFSDIEE